MTLTVVVPGCACLDRSLPEFSVEAGSQFVVIYNESHLAPDRCREIGEVSAEDGLLGSARWSYDGTRERTLEKLQSEAFRLGGNAVKVSDEPALPSQIGVDDVKGSIVALKGIALRC